MSEKFTHGPWVFTEPVGEEHAEVRDKDGRRIAVAIGGYPMGTRTEDANAKLISAAPDLYAALKDLYYIVYEASDSDLVLEMGMRIQQVASDALRKARGDA